MALNGGWRLRGIPQTSEIMTTGNVYFVSSVSGLDSYSGEDIAHPFATLDYATGKCTANNNDIVYIMPNHAETISGATTWVPDVAGVQYIGIGTGSDMPELTFSATASKVAATADNLTFKNIRFVAGISAVVQGVSATGDFNTFDGCQWDFSTTAYDFVTMLRLDTSHRSKVINCHFRAENAVAGSNNAIEFDDCDFLRIENNTFSGDFARSVIETLSSDAVSVSIMVLNNQIYNDDTASTFGGGIHFPVAHTGIIAYNNIAHLNDDEGDIVVDPGSCLMMENYTCTAIDTYGVATLIGTASS